MAQIFSAEDPESLRGPQFDAAWGDELAKWNHAEATWDMLQFGLRLGVAPRQVVTTTPRPTPLLKRLMDESRSVISHAPTRPISPTWLRVSSTPSSAAIRAHDWGGRSWMEN